MAIELNNRTKILAGVVVLAAAGAAAWFFFLEDFLAEPPPKPAAAKAAPADAPKQGDAAKPGADAPAQAGAPAAATGAAAAKPGAKPIPTSPDRLLTEVIETSGMISFLQTLARDAMLSASAGNAARTQAVNPADYAHAVEVVNRVFEPAALTAEIIANLKGTNYDVERMERFLELLRQPISAKMTAAEMRSVTPEATREHAEGQRKNPLPAARVKLIQTLDDATQASEIGADLGGALAREMVDAMIDSMKKKSKNAPAESPQNVGARLNAMRNQSRAQVRSLMYVMYRKASDEELSEYVKLLDTDTGRWGSELLAGAVRPLVMTRGSVLGRDTAQYVAARPAGPKEAAQPVAQQEEKPAEQPAAAAPPAAPVAPPGYQRPANIREAYSRYNDLVSATVMRDRAAVKELLDDGKNPNARQSDGLTPLMIAASNGDTDIATMLLAKGADPSLRAGGRTALSIAKSRGSAGAATAQLLERSGARE